MATEEVKAAPKKEGKAGKIIVDVILVLAIILLLVISFTAFVTKSGSGVPSFFGIRPFAIQSDSMSPTFDKGDLIVDTVVKDASTLKEGDVITFWTVIEGQRVLNSHRIIGIQDYGDFVSFVTMGDNNTMEDGLQVHQKEVVGKYMFRIPKLGTVVDFLQTSKGFLLVIVVPVALFFIYQLISFFKALFAYQAEKNRLQFEAEMEARYGRRPDEEDKKEKPEPEKEKPEELPEKKPEEQAEEQPEEKPEEKAE